MPNIFEIAGEFDQKRYICSIFLRKFSKFSKNVIYARRYIIYYAHSPLYVAPAQTVARCRFPTLGAGALPPGGEPPLGPARGGYRIC